MFGVRRFITAFISLAVIVFLEDHGDDGVVPQVRSTQKGKQQSIAALQIDGKSRAYGCPVGAEIQNSATSKLTLRVGVVQNTA